MTAFQSNKQKTRLVRRLLGLWAPAVTMLVSLAIVPSAPAQSERDEAADERTERLQQMRERVLAIKAYGSADFTGKPLALTNAPLLRFDDPARHFHDATLWAWQQSGRPIALVTIERYKAFWSYELISLTSGDVSAAPGFGVRWTPRKPGVEWKEFPNAPAPSSSTVGRLRQMKSLVRGFSATETNINEEIKLRLLPQPVHRYSDTEAGLVDGALFIFAFGTNPEIVACIEARRENPSDPAWYYGFASLAAARLVVRLDERIVWTKPTAPAMAIKTATYIHFREPEE